MTGILRLRHRNKLNTYKQGRDRLFHVATNIPTQGREALLQHNRTGSRQKDEMKAKSLVAIENIYNTNRLWRNIKMKLQQEIRLNGNKTLLWQTFLVATEMLTI